jgi:HAD superfamily hydrolase (TIGR01509 family)
MTRINHLLFDAANTLIHKPTLWDKWIVTLKKYGYEIPLDKLKHDHKQISEVIRFPDQTSKDFYAHFNSELLYSLGIIPEQNLLTEIFQACTYLPWEKFDDTIVLNSLNRPLSIISNFNKNLTGTIENLFGDLFQKIIISENYGVAKPDIRFYELALKELEIEPDSILYIGDSLKLDMEPAAKIGMNTLLIDRNNMYPFYSKRITNLSDLLQHL